MFMKNNSIKEILRTVSAFFFPERCPYCAALIEPDDISCPKCNRSVLGQAVTIRRGVIGSRCVAPFSYEGRVRKAIVNFKFYDMPQYARPLAAVLAKTVKEEYPVDEIDLITYVPLHKKDLIKREYNQSQLLANELSDIFSIPCEETLIKTKYTKKQHKLNFSERKKNLSGAFSLVDKEQIKGKTVLLIDDVMTSGNTLALCVKKLYSAKTLQVYCAVVACAAEHERTERKQPQKEE